MTAGAFRGIGRASLIQLTTLPMHGSAEHVFVENAWYDGPRGGVANVNGVPHRFVSDWDSNGDQYLDTFLVWPIHVDELALEQEQWLIFVRWNDQFEAGTLDSSSHPGLPAGHPGTDMRWDVINGLLEKYRNDVPPNALRARATFVPLDREQRYSKTGPAYQLCWTLLRPDPVAT